MPPLLGNILNPSLKFWKRRPTNHSCDKLDLVPQKKENSHI